MVPPNPLKGDLKECRAKTWLGTAKSLSLKVVLSNYTLNIAKAISKEEIKLVLDSYSKEINSFNF
jgi:hypothetical protein